MAPALSDDTLKSLTCIKRYFEPLNSDPKAHTTNVNLENRLRELANLTRNDPQQRTLLGENPTFMEIISHLWVFAMDKIHANEDYITLGATQDMVLRLAQLTRNVAAGCPNNQLWIMRNCELSIRRLLHFFTGWYRAQETAYHRLTTAIVQCLANVVTGNEESSCIIWTTYMDLEEKDNVITRLLEYPARNVVSATLVFILNSLSTRAEHSLILAQRVGGRATCVSLLEKSDRIFDDEENEDIFQLIYNIFTKVFQCGSLAPLYKSLQPPDGTISPHQITLLQLLDAYTYDEPSTFNANACLTTFLPTTLRNLLDTIKAWSNNDPGSGIGSRSAPNENLPPVAAATVLISQTLANGLMAEQLAWENSMDKASTKRPMLEFLKNPSDLFVELILGICHFVMINVLSLDLIIYEDVLRRLNQILPRIQFGKVKPMFTRNESVDQPATLDASGFQFLKRDLVRLLGIITHEDPGIQVRVRECGGVQLVLGLCAIDESNPYIREHALFTLRNLLHNNAENQRIVKEMEPMGRIDENGILTGL
ncbi:Extracellular matrix protein 14 [Ceratobasidium theobromae]|uniref:Ataxin-10 homolog n=1 Tax=Ceratobasidium theobromae TaxID=1582974 RepID=A0A5N5QQ58_9AGAM|nr:Extracellular matrix protein 14 [Ceratobasidium theobromae]